MLYQTYQLQDDIVGRVRYAATWARTFSAAVGWAAYLGAARRFEATLELTQRFRLTNARPEFHIQPVRVGNRDVPVTEEVVLDLPFGKLRHFVKDVETPKVLVLGLT